MICPECKKEFAEKDFLGKTTCFRCTYASKCRVLPVIKRLCRMCGNDIPSNRTKYCSGICSELADQQRSSKAWFRNINVLQAYWH